MLPAFRVTVSDGTCLPGADGLKGDEAHFDCDTVSITPIGPAHNIVGFRGGRPAFSVIAGQPEVDMQDHILPATLAWFVTVHAPACDWLRVYSFAGKTEKRRPH